MANIFSAFSAALRANKKSQRTQSLFLFVLFFSFPLLALFFLRAPRLCVKIHKSFSVHFYFSM